MNEMKLSTNVNIQGYTLLATKSQSQSGDVGIYIKTCLGSVPRTDLVGDSNVYETVWFEIENSKDKNILICSAYRHPSSEIKHFSEYFQRTLSSPSVANKHVFILGDFNINLLNYDSHTPTCDFVLVFLSIVFHT